MQSIRRLPLAKVSARYTWHAHQLTPQKIGEHNAIRPTKSQLATRGHAPPDQDAISFFGNIWSCWMRKKQIATAADFECGQRDLRQTKQPQDMRYSHFCTLPRWVMDSRLRTRKGQLLDRQMRVHIDFDFGSAGTMTPWAVICIFASFLPHRERCKTKDERAAKSVRRLRYLIGFCVSLSIFNNSWLSAKYTN